MTAEGWTQAVRRQLGLGRVLPLGGAADGVWVTESAVDGALRQMAERVPGVRLGTLRLALAAPAEAGTPAVPPPPSALPPGPLRVTGEFAAVAGEPLPAAADRLRAALYEAAAGLGLVTAEVDLKVTALLDEADGTDEVPARPTSDPPHPPVPEGSDTDEARAERAALSVPGVTRLTGVLGRAVHFEEPPATGTLPRRHARVELATAREHRALDVALAVRKAVGAALPDGPSVAVLVTEVR
ncbi:nucleopolyhedrovirus P10 family protein [Streptomyces venezuelae]|uniref:nucleopolyhedrovirus P10 family protein n=1 Tax=Streptomyces venezuelae TaxID=54571 RepID=UPI0037A8051C